MEERSDSVVGYFDAPVGHDERLPPDLAAVATWEAVDDTDWVAAYLSEVGPVDVGRLVIAPTHATVTLRSPQRPIWIDPGLAFGSGHHETTRLALVALDDGDLSDARVLDVGSGSGILAIAADLLGAAAAHGIDTDAATLPVARENAARNGSRAAFAHRELPADAGPWAGWADVVVANIYAEVHATLAAAYRSALRPGGRALLTGIVDGKQGTVAAALAAAGFDATTWRRDGVWWLVEAAGSPEEDAP